MTNEDSPGELSATLTDDDRKARSQGASDRLLSLVPTALDVIETQLRTLDPDTKREIAFRVLDEAHVTPKARAKALGLTLGGEGGDSLSPLVASALRGAFQGLGEALGAKFTSPPARDAPRARDVTPPPPAPAPRSRVRPALSKGDLT